MGLKRQIQLQEVIKNDKKKKNAEITGASPMMQNAASDLGLQFAQVSKQTIKSI